MLGTREYTLCSPFRANAHNSSYVCFSTPFYFTMILRVDSASTSNISLLVASGGGGDKSEI